MLKIFAAAGLAALVTACAAPSPSAADDPMGQARGSTTSGDSTAAVLGFHGPVDRAIKTDGPN
jgi:hypothetical protein